MAFLDAVKSILSGVPSAIEHIPSEVETGARGIGSVLADARAPGVPGYAVDPLSGQMQQTQSPPTRVNFWKNMLSGALTGLAASHPGENFGQALGGGFQAAQQQRQRQDLLARDEAQRQFENQQAAQRMQIERSQAADTALLNQAQRARLAMQNHIDTFNLAKAKAQLGPELQDAYARSGKNFENEGYMNLGELKLGESFAHIIAANPKMAQDVALGHYVAIPIVDDDGKIVGHTIYVRSPAYRDPNAPDTLGQIAMPSAGPRGLTWSMIAPGTVTNSQGERYRNYANSVVNTQAKNAEAARHNRAIEGNDTRRTNIEAANAPSLQEARSARTQQAQDAQVKSLMAVGYGRDPLSGAMIEAPGATAAAARKKIAGLLGLPDDGGVAGAAQTSGAAGAGMVHVRFVDGSEGLLPADKAALAVAQKKGTIVGAPAPKPAVGSSLLPGTINGYTGSH